MTSLNLPTSSVEPSSTSVPQDKTSRAPSRAVAEQFSHQYYTVFSNYPRYLYRFYDQSSVQSIMETFEDGTFKEELSNTQQCIHDVVLRLFCDAKAHVENVTSQFSQSGGVLIQVSGILFRKGCRDSSFVQSFFLAVQERGFFVLNDILHISPRLGSQKSGWTDSSNPVMLNENVLQPTTPRDGLAVGGQSSTKAYGMTGQTAPRITPPPDPEQISQILAETKEVLNATVQSQVSDSPQQQKAKPTYAELLKCNSSNSCDGTPTAGATTNEQEAPFVPRHSKTRSYGDVQSSLANVSFNTATTPQSGGGFLLPSRRRNSISGGSCLARNASVFVRDIPAGTEEKDLKQVFEQFGEVISIVIRTGKRDSHFAFVDFAETRAMEKALAADSVSFRGRRLGIQEKKPIVIRNKSRYQGYRGSSHPLHNANDLSRMTGDSSCQQSRIGIGTSSGNAATTAAGITH